MLSLFAIKYFNISYPVQVTTRSTSGELAVVGEGKVDAVPDMATVNVGITVNNAPTVADAQNQISKTNNAVISALQALGVQKQDITTSNYSVNPAYSYDASANRITGYNGDVSLVVKIRNVTLAPQVVEVATKNGANQVGNIQFTIDHPEKYREMARDNAIKNAKVQAQKLASQLGIHLGNVTNIVENGSSQPSIIRPMMAKSADSGVSLPPDIEQGSQTVTSQVTLYFDKR